MNLSSFDKEVIGVGFLLFSASWLMIRHLSAEPAVGYIYVYEMLARFI